MDTFIFRPSTPTKSTAKPSVWPEQENDVFQETAAMRVSLDLVLGKLMDEVANKDNSGQLLDAILKRHVEKLQTTKEDRRRIVKSKSNPAAKRKRSPSEPDADPSERQRKAPKPPVCRPKTVASTSDNPQPEVHVDKEHLSRVDKPYVSGRVWKADGFTDISHVMLDTCGHVNLLSFRTIELLALEIKQQDESWQLSGFGGGTAMISKCVEFELTMAGVTRKVIAHVDEVTKGHRFLLAATTMHEFGLQLDCGKNPITVYTLEGGAYAELPASQEDDDLEWTWYPKADVGYCRKLAKDPYFDDLPPIAFDFSHLDGRYKRAEHDLFLEKKARRARAPSPPERLEREVDLEREYAVKAILQETKTHYLIDWEDDKMTGEHYESSWEPKGNANKQAVADWKKRRTRGRRSSDPHS